MKKLYLIGLIAGLFICQNSLFAQRNCGTMEYLQMQIEQDPQRAERLEAIDHFTANVLASSAKTIPATITIPTVVHVVYRTSSENISMSQIQSQIEVLNLDFQRLNSDTNNIWPQAGNPRIEFCLASVDPQGNATDGVTRTQTTRTSFNSNDKVKKSNSGGQDPWPTDFYLNIWVCNLGGGLLGYAQFPGGPAATDGVVIDYEAFGTTGTADAPFDMGRSTTHEVGHYLNLHHIWGDYSGCGSDDGVSDTPAASGPHYGCQIGASSCGSTDMVQNYMDYSDDACMNLFTTNQNSRMRALFEPGGFREGLLNSGACGGELSSCNDGIQNGLETGIDCGGPDCAPCSCDGVQVSLLMNLSNDPTETTWFITDSLGAIVQSGGPYAPGQIDVIEEFCLPQGCFTFTSMGPEGEEVCCDSGYIGGFYRLYVTETGEQLFAMAEMMNTHSTGFCSSAPIWSTCYEQFVDYNNFETGLGIWNDGGSDCLRKNTPHALSGDYLMVLRDNSSSSVLYTDPLDMSNVENVGIAYAFITKGMDNSSEGFLLEYSIDGGITYTLEKAYYLHTDFENMEPLYLTRDIPGPLSENTVFRFRSFGNQNNDMVGIDLITIGTCTPVNSERNTPEISAAPEQISETKPVSLLLFPNPSRDAVTLRFETQREAPVYCQIYSLTGKLLLAKELSGAINGVNEWKLDLSDLTNGTYVVQVIQADQKVVQRLVLLK